MTCISAIDCMFEAHANNAIIQSGRFPKEQEFFQLNNVHWNVGKYHNDKLYTVQNAFSSQYS